MKSKLRKTFEAIIDRVDAWLTKHQMWLLTLAATLVLTLITACVAAPASPLVAAVGIAVTVYRAVTQRD